MLSRGGGAAVRGRTARLVIPTMVVDGGAGVVRGIS